MIASPDMRRLPTIWRLLGLALLALALVVVPGQVMAGATGADPCHPVAAAPHHDCGDLSMSTPDCVLICSAMLPASSPDLAELASYVLRFRDADTLRVGIILSPETPPPR